MSKSLNRALFPLYSRWWFAGDVVDYSIDVRYLVNDAIGDVGEKVVREACPIGSHSVLAGHGAQGYQIAVSPIVSHNADALNIGKDGKSLP